MKKIVVMVLLLVNFITCPVYALNKIGLGTDFFHKDGPIDQREWDIGLRFYYEHLLKEFLGIQLELGYLQSHFEYRHDYYDEDFYNIDLSMLLKYYFPLKSQTSAYIAGGLGLEHTKFSGLRATSLFEQVSIGMQFPITNRFSIFIEDRFKNKISEGQLRAGIYLNLSKQRGVRR